MSVEENELVDIVEFISKYQEPNKELVSFLIKYNDNLIVLKDNAIIGVAFYLRLHDETLEEICDNPEILQDIKNSEKLILEKGRNIHFIRVFAKDYKVVLKGLKQSIKKENPKTVSWYKEDMNEIRFIKFRS